MAKLERAYQPRVKSAAIPTNSLRRPKARYIVRIDEIVARRSHRDRLGHLTA